MQRLLAVIVAAVALATGCGAEDDAEPKPAETAPRVLTTTQPGALDPKEAFLLTADLACRRVRYAIARFGAAGTLPRVLRASVRVEATARRWLRRMEREGIPPDLPGAQRYRDALAEIVDLYRDGRKAILGTDLAAAKRVDRRGTRAYNTLKRLSDRLGISGC